MSAPTSSAVRALAMEYKSMEDEPVEGFCVKLVNDESLFEWEVAIFGPPDTLYQGGYFKVSSSFIQSVSRADGRTDSQTDLHSGYTHELLHNDHQQPSSGIGPHIINKRVWSRQAGSSSSHKLYVHNTLIYARSIK